MRILRVLGVAVALLGVIGCSSSGPADESTWNEARGKDGVGMLDGKRFTVDVSEMGKSGSEKENLEFHGGRFHSDACDPYGFATGAYSSTKNGDVITFRAATESATEGHIDWRGMIRGESIEGAYTRTKKGQKPIEYTYRGQRAP
jgi:hypothetical protein